MPRIIVTSPFPRLPRSVPEDVLAVTPHRPAARALRSPHISLQDLARRVLAASGIGVAEPRIAARELRESAAQVFPRIEPSAAARRVLPMLRTILRVGIDTLELKAQGSRRACELAEVAEIFRQRLRDKGLVHTDAIVWEAANLPGIEQRPLLIYGYPRARKEEIAFINKLAAEGSIYYLPLVEGSDAFRSNHEHALQMKGWGWTLETPASEPAAVGERAAAVFVGYKQECRVAAHSLQNVAAETRYVLSEVKNLLRAGTTAGEIAIAVRDLNLYAKEFSIVGAEYGVPTVSSLRIPLSETLVGGLVERLLAAVEKDFCFEEAVRLLGHPLGPGMCDETWKRSRRERTATYEKWLAMEESLGCLDAIRSGEGKLMSGWVDCFRSILRAFDVRGRAGHGAREIVAYNRFQEELSFAAAAADEDEIGFHDLASAIRDILGSVKTPFDPARLGVLVTEPDMLVGGRFRHVFVMGMAEGILPARPVENAVIDFHERSLLAKKGFEFEEAADIPRWEALSFFSLLSTATGSITLTYPKNIGKEGKIKSSFFARLGVGPTPAQPAVLCSEAELTRNTLRKNIAQPFPLYEAAAYRLKVECARESAARHDEYDGAIGEAIDITGRVWSVSQLSSLAGCGFKWFANYGLRVKPADEMEIEVTHAAKGKLFHFALDHAVSKGGARTPAEIADRLAAALEAGYRDPDVAMPALRNWELIKAEYLAALTRAVKAAEFLSDGCEIAATEKEFVVDLYGLRVRGRIDRVDRTPDGLVAVDYKTGKYKPKPVQDRDGRKLDLQLAVYLAAMRMLYPGENVAGGVYYSLSGCRSHKGSVAEEEVLAEFLTAVVEAPRTGSLAVRPISKDTCTYCDYDHLCRKGARLLRKEAI